MAIGEHFTRSGLSALREVGNRSHPSLRWGQAICNTYRIGPMPELYYAGDAKVQEIIERWIRDYQL